MCVSRYAVARQFQEYSEPDQQYGDGSGGGGSSLIGEKQAPVVVGKRRDTEFNYLHPSITDDPEKVLVPLEEGVFETNLGLPLFVVVTKVTLVVVMMTLWAMTRE